MGEPYVHDNRPRTKFILRNFGFKPRNLGQYFLYQFLGIIISSHIFQVFSMFTDWVKERHFSRLLMRRHLYANFAILFNVVSNALPFAVTSFYTELRVQFLKYFWQALLRSCTILHFFLSKRKQNEKISLKVSEVNILFFMGTDYEERSMRKNPSL